MSAAKYPCLVFASLVFPSWNGAWCDYERESLTTAQKRCPLQVGFITIQDLVVHNQDRHSTKVVAGNHRKVIERVITPAMLLVANPATQHASRTAARLRNTEDEPHGADKYSITFWIACHSNGIHLNRAHVGAGNSTPALRISASGPGSFTNLCLAIRSRGCRSRTFNIRRVPCEAKERQAGVHRPHDAGGVAANPHAR